MIRSLKTPVIFLSAYTPFKSLFRLSYAVCFSLLTLLFKFCPFSGALLLRRAGSLKDCFPGNSDFDFIWLIKTPPTHYYSTLRRAAILHKIFHFFIPILGETLFAVQPENTPCSITSIRSPDDCIAFEKSHTLRSSPAPLTHSPIHAREVFIHGLQRAYFNCTETFQRNLIKSARRLETMLLTPRNSIIYDNASHYRLNSEEERQKYLKAGLKVFSLYTPPQLDISIRLEPNKQILAKHGSIFECAYRPYTPCKALFLIFPETSNTAALAHSMHFAKTIFDTTEIFKTHKVFSHPFVFTERAFKNFLHLDPLLNLTYATTFHPGASELELSSSILKQELLRTWITLYTTVRSTQPVYYCELLFISIPVLIELLENQVFHSSLGALKQNSNIFKNLSREEGEIFEVLESYDLKRLHSFKEERVWEVTAKRLQYLKERSSLVCGVSI